VSWLLSLDVAVFRFVNGTLSNSFLDTIMPWMAGNVWFFPVLIAAAAVLLWKGGARARLMALMLAIVVPLGDGWITNSIKHAVERPRPCLTLERVNLPLTRSRAADADDDFRRRGCSSSGSMPSGHTSNWFSAAMVAWLFYRRSAFVLLPFACLMGFSRVYLGVHYPSDVLAGAVIGAGYGIAIPFAVNALWRRIGREWFPFWWNRLPSLLPTQTPAAPPECQTPAPNHAPGQHWLRLGYALIALVFIGRVIFIAGARINLSEDEAYQWLWSKHLALSYFSKPPLIAYVQWLGTHLFGDRELGVRFFSPVCAAIGSLVMLRFFARHVTARAGFWLVVLMNVTPLLALGSTLLTVDPLLVLFWTLAMAAGWRAAQPEGQTRDWLWVGLWMGLGFLSKYTALLQWLCWAVFFAIFPPARIQLRRPGPYLALLVNVLCMTPVLIWNAQHGWITAAHVATDAKLDEAWHFSVKPLLEFLGGSAGLLHPVIFLAMIWAAVKLWRGTDALPRYFFAMGAPLFLVYLLYTLHSSVQINWIAAAIIPLWCMTAAFWDARERAGARAVRGWLAAAVVAGVAAVAMMHESDWWIGGTNKILARFSQEPLSGRADPLRRVRGWPEMAKIVARERRKLEGEGKPVFVVAGHYGTTSLLSFYMPEAKAAATRTPLVYCRHLKQPKTQFFFWPSYINTRQGENAIYVIEKDKPATPPPDVIKSFESVTEVGRFPVKHRGRTLHTVQIFACRNLR
jgi:membrane-associated phospholipid phosphatase